MNVPILPKRNKKYKAKYIGEATATGTAATFLLNQGRRTKYYLKPPHPITNYTKNKMGI